MCFLLLTALYNRPSSSNCVVRLIPEEDAKAKAQLEQANKALSRELEEVKSTLSQTEETLKAVEEQKTIYHDQIIKTSNTLMSSVKGLLAVLKKVRMCLLCICWFIFTLRQEMSFFHTDIVDFYTSCVTVRSSAVGVLTQTQIIGTKAWE